MTTRCGRGDLLQNPINIEIPSFKQHNSITILYIFWIREGSPYIDMCVVWDSRHNATHPNFVSATPFLKSVFCKAIIMKRAGNEVYFLISHACFNLHDFKLKKKLKHPPIMFFDRKQSRKKKRNHSAVCIFCCFHSS